VNLIYPENTTYTSANVTLEFTVNKQTSWMSYSLDGQDNVIITSNTTLSGLTSGLHNVTVYAKDTYENTGASQTIIFTIAEKPEPFPTAVVAALSCMTATIIGVGLLVHFKKHKH
jgi:hypothetical protein